MRIPVWLCRIVFVYHRFGYYKKNCVKCGLSEDEAYPDRFIVDIDYDLPANDT